MLGKFFSSEEISKDFGLLLVRLGIGLSVPIFYGFNLIKGGEETWRSVGGNMGNLSVHFAPVFFGFMAAFAECVCSCLLVLGVLFRPATFLLAFTMFVAINFHLHRPAGSSTAGWSGASHALELLAVYLCLFFTGPGRFSLTMRR